MPTRRKPVTTSQILGSTPRVSASTTYVVMPDGTVSRPIKRRTGKRSRRRVANFETRQVQLPRRSQPITRKKQKTKQPTQSKEPTQLTTQPTKLREIRIRYESQQHGWIVEGEVGRLKIFATRRDAEHYCTRKLGQFPVAANQSTARHQDLRRSSVWTGAPWDDSFAKIK